MEFLIEWTKNWAYSPYSLLALFILAFIESIFFPVPPDILLISMALLAPKKAFLFASVCSLASVSGGIAGYLLGLRCGYPILRRITTPHFIEKVHNYYQRYEAYAILIAAFTPIPYKVFTVSAGIFYVNLKVFILASLIGRSARFFLVASILFIFGERLQNFILKNFDIFTISFAILILAGFICLKFIFRKKTTS